MNDVLNNSERVAELVYRYDLSQEFNDYGKCVFSKDGLSLWIDNFLTDEGVKKLEHWIDAYIEND